MTNAARRFQTGLAGLAGTYNADQAVTRERATVRLWMPEPFPAGATVLAAIFGGMATEQDYGVNIAGRKVIGHLKLAWRHEPRPFGSRMWL